MLDHLITPSLLRLQSERGATGNRYLLGQDPGKYPFAGQITKLARPKGQGLVELGIVIPVLVVIVVGALDLGRIFFAVITVTNVSREGARYLTLHPEDELADSTNPNCYDLVVTLPDPTYKEPYFCTIAAARQEAEASFAIIDPSQITILPFCPDTDDEIEGCDRPSEAKVTAIYDFRPITLWFLPDTLEIRRTTKMMVP